MYLNLDLSCWCLVFSFICRGCPLVLLLLLLLVSCCIAVILSSGSAFRLRGGGDWGTRKVYESSLLVLLLLVGECVTLEFTNLYGDGEYFLMSALDGDTVG
jgi:hypothetical protein